MAKGRPITNWSNRWSEYHANLLYKIAIQVTGYFHRAYGLQLDKDDLVAVAWIKLARYRDVAKMKRHAGYIRRLMLRRGYDILKERGELADVGEECQSIDEFGIEGEVLSESQMQERFALPELSSLEDWETVCKLLRGVCNRRMAMVAVQYYLLEWTMDRIGERMGITGERVRQLLQEFQQRATAYVNDHRLKE